MCGGCGGWWLKANLVIDFGYNLGLAKRNNRSTVCVCKMFSINCTDMLEYLNFKASYYKLGIQDEILDYNY